MGGHPTRVRAIPLGLRCKTEMIIKLIDATEVDRQARQGDRILKERPGTANEIGTFAELTDGAHLEFAVLR